MIIAAPLPPRIREAGRRLRRVSVYNLNLGVARPRLSDKHWLYFPERRFVFYRVGFPHNFSPRLAPRGTSSMYIEVSRRPGERAAPAAHRRIDVRRTDHRGGGAHA